MLEYGIYHIEGEIKNMLAKFAVSQIFGVPAGYVSYAMLSSLGNTPIYVPLIAWLLTSLYIIKKL
jgi:hypothetical protein